MNYRFAPDKTLPQAKTLMMGADAGAELGNGEHVATGGVFEGFGIEMKDESPSARPGMDAPMVVSLAKLVRERTGREPLAKLGWTDVARFSLLGVPAVNLGAGARCLRTSMTSRSPKASWRPWPASWRTGSPAAHERGSGADVGIRAIE